MVLSYSVRIKFSRIKKGEINLTELFALFSAYMRNLVASGVNYLLHRSLKKCRFANPSKCTLAVLAIKQIF